MPRRGTVSYGPLLLSLLSVVTCTYDGVRTSRLHGFRLSSWQGTLPGLSSRLVCANLARTSRPAREISPLV